MPVLECVLHNEKFLKQTLCLWSQYGLFVGCSENPVITVFSQVLNIICLKQYNICIDNHKIKFLTLKCLVTKIIDLVSKYSI